MTESDVQSLLHPDALKAAVAAVDGDADAVVGALGDLGGHAVGLAAAQRGTVDRGNPEVLAAYDRVRAALGPEADDAVRRGSEVARDEGRAALVAYAGEPAAQVRRW
jgi:hypothetical protein